MRDIIGPLVTLVFAVATTALFLVFGHGACAGEIDWDFSRPEKPKTLADLWEQQKAGGRPAIVAVNAEPLTTVLPVDCYAVEADGVKRWILYGSVHGHQAVLAMWLRAAPSDDEIKAALAQTLPSKEEMDFKAANNTKAYDAALQRERSRQVQSAPQIVPQWSFQPQAMPSFQQGFGGFQGMQFGGFGGQPCGT